MLISFVYSVQPTFIDELDNIVNGQFIAAGKVPYKDFFSQHTPLAYYISGLGHLLGAHTVFLQRLFLYSLFSIAFSFLIKRQRQYFGVAAPFVTAIVYLSSHASNPDLSYTFLSDQIQGVAYIYIAFELLLIHRRKTIQPSSVWIISLFGFLAIGVAFISVYFVSISIILFFSLFLWINRNDIKTNRFRLLKKTLSNIAVFAVPFALTGIYFVITGALKDFYLQAYLVNREVYSKYIGGLGTNPMSPFLDAPEYFWTYTVSSWNQIEFLNIGNLRNFQNFFFLYLLVVILIFRRLPFLAIGLGILLILSAQRGVTGFHSQPFWGLSSLAVGLVLFDKIYGFFSFFDHKKTKVFRYATISSVAAITFFGFFQLVLNPLPPGSILPFQKSESLYTKVVNTLVTPGGSFGDTSLNLYGYVLTERLPSTGGTGIVPWMTDMFEDDYIAKLETARPTLIFHNPKNAVWGYVLDEYAPKLNSYIGKNYKRVPITNSDFGGNFLFLRNSTYTKSLTKLKDKFPQFFAYEEFYSTVRVRSFPVGELQNGLSIRQTFKPSRNNISTIRIGVATYARSNTCLLSERIYGEDGMLIARQDVKCQDLKDNSWLDLSFPAIKDSAGKKLILEVHISNASQGNSVTLWASPKEELFPSKLEFNGKDLDAVIHMSLQVASP